MAALSGPPPLIYCPNYQTLSATTVSRSEHSRIAREKLAVLGLDVAPVVEVDAQLGRQALRLRSNKAKSQDH